MASRLESSLHPRAIWLFFFGGAAQIFILMFLVMSATILLVGSLLGSLYVIVFWGLEILVILVGYYIWSRLEYKFYKYTLTDDAFKKELGVVYKKYVTIPYDRIQNIDIYRGILHRILGLSDLHIQTAGGASGYQQQNRWGVFSEANLPGLLHEDAEALRDELLRRMKLTKNTKQ